MPFSPAGQKNNLVGWLVARNDWPHYGQLKSYQLPDDRQIDGPSQVERGLKTTMSFPQLFTLWDGAGSKMIRGRLLVIPIADTIVYVEPLYLQSEVLNFPELKKVILADNTNLVMAAPLRTAWPCCWRSYLPGGRGGYPRAPTREQVQLQAPVLQRNSRHN